MTRLKFTFRQLEYKTRCRGKRANVDCELDTWILLARHLHIPWSAYEESWLYYYTLIEAVSYDYNTFSIAQRPVIPTFTAPANYKLPFRYIPQQKALSNFNHFCYNILHFREYILVIIFIAYLHADLHFYKYIFTISVMYR